MDPRAKARDDRDLIRAEPFRETNGDLPHNASEVVALGDSRFLFCDNNISDALFEIRLTRAGRLAGGLIRHSISGVSPRFFDDFESMAMVGDARRQTLVLATSFSLKIADHRARMKRNRGRRAIERESLLRLIRTGPSALGAEIVPGFRQWLIEHTPDLGRRWRRSLERIPDDGGLNVEGLAWDPRRSELHFGLRTPVLRKRPVILRVHVRDINGLWNLDNFEMRPPVLLDLPDADGTRGIRTIEYDARRQATLIVTGNAVSHTRVPFELWTWDGSSEGRVRKFANVRFHRRFRVEGVTPGTVGGRPVLVFVDDRGGYQVMWDEGRLGGQPAENEPGRGAGTTRRVER